MKFFLTFLISFSVLAQTGNLNTESIKEDLKLYYNISLEQIYLTDQRGRITFSRKWPLDRNSYLVATISENKICKLPILEISDKEGQVNLAYCPFIKELKRNQLLSLPPLLVKVDPTFRENSVYNEEKNQIGDLPSKNESWYIFSSLGVAPIEYAPSITEAVQSFTGETSMSNLGLAVDALGIYWPLGNRSILGGIFGFVYENYKTSGVFNETPTTTIAQNGTLNFWQLSLTASFMHFFGQNIGDGLFLRGDVGLSSLYGSLYVSYTANNSTLEPENQDFSYTNGPAFLIGGGYAWPFSLSTRLMGSLSYSVKTSLYEGEITANKMVIASLGLLF